MAKFNTFLLLFVSVFVTTGSFAASREEARIGVGTRRTQTATRMPLITPGAAVQTLVAQPVVSVATQPEPEPVETPVEEEKVVEVVTPPVVHVEPDEPEEPDVPEVKPVVAGDCRDAYRDCMDQFCLLDESQGERCACSENIYVAKDKIREILSIQAEADKLFTEGVEREQLGAKARLVFGENTRNTQISVADFMSWVNDGADDYDYDDEEEVGEDVTMGSKLLKMATKYCAAELESCGSKAEMESMLYSRMVIQDCKSYDAYLKDQKTNAELNKRTAETAVRKARLEMLDTTNKYNRGECLLAYRACISDKGGCGVNFENCLDSKLLARRSNACENVLDQCMAVRDYVKKDWAEESKSVLKEAAKYADKNYRMTCLAQIQNCLEEGCATTTNSECLVDVNVAAGICPIITECNATIPGLQVVINDKLKYLQTKFCENDVDKCLRDKCGADFTKPECVGKKPYEIAALCPQDMFPSCKEAKQYDIIVQSVLLQLDYQMLQGCINYFDAQLSKVCGTDMACLPTDATVESLVELPTTAEALGALRGQVIANSDAAVEEFFKQFEQEKTVAACSDSQSIPAKKVKGKQSMGISVFNTAKLLAKMSAENRNLRELDSKIAELTRTKDLETARQTCLNTYKKESPDESKSNYSYIHTVSFEPDLRNCRVCRIQQVCETGGESKASSALKSAAGGLSAGASMGTMVNAGWGTAIGGIVGAVGTGVLGYMSGGKEEFCQEIESCEDINM